MNHSPFIKVISLVGFTASIPSLFAQSSLQTFAAIEAGFDDGSLSGQGSTYNLPGGFALSNTGETFNLSSSGNFGPMSFSGQANTSASFGTLGTSVDGLLENSVFVPFFPEEGPSGTENFFRVTASASWTDTLTYDGPSAGYFSNYVLNLSGSIAGENAFNFVTLQHANEPAQQWFFSSTGDYDLQLVSDAFFHEGSAQVTVTFQSLYQVYTGSHPDGSTTSGLADFSNTLILDGIEVTDQSGIPQPGTTITSASGTLYSVIGIPEPSTALLAFSALALFGAGRRR